MNLLWIDWARRGSQVLGAGLVATLGLRIMIGAIREAQAQRTTTPEVAELPEQPALLELAEELMGTPPEAPPPRPEAAVVIGPSLRLMLSVVVGPERSEVYVNGRRLGFSPYLGDFTCKQGESLKIEVVPVTQPLITRQAKCMGQNLFIRD